MKQEIRSSIDLIQAEFEMDLRASVKAVSEGSSSYGYALMIGEDLDMAAPIAVSNSESNLGSSNDNDIRYIPDEWSRWSYDHFDNFSASYKDVYKRFEATHNVTDEDCCYTNDAIEFMNQLYTMYLTGMKKVVAEFSSIWYWVIWIPDSDREIVKNSFLELNSGRALKEASIYFE
ncbi:DUF4303 domain-containing protein [Microbulbifer sp. EKSA005]|uniref:DUF4303 domain-containing protein n=1 Tax=Microbulbifer sp. EKSA005 TaxID=3243364 RepID=UPI0040419AD6